MKVERMGSEVETLDGAGSLSGSDRVLAVLNLLGSYPNGIGLNDLARLLNSPRSSVHRALGALRRADLVEQDRDSRYRLGYGLLKLAFSYYEEFDEVGRIRPVLMTLAKEFGETAHYALLDGSEVVYLAKVQPPTSRYQMTSVIGGRNPAYCTGVGKALLAYALTSRTAVDDFVVHHEPPMVAHTVNTITSARALHRELSAVREVGYALDRQENETGINCLAIPLFLTSKVKPDGAVSITAVAQRLGIEELEASVERVRSIIRENLGEVLE
jgi:IclR family transcriptional regulator, acetate operon repressor